MTCKNLIAICSKTHMPCPYVATNGECREAECANAVVPTWGEFLDIYEAAMHPKRSRMSNLRSCFNTLVRALGTSLDAKVAVSDEQMDAAYATLLEGREPETVDSIFCAFKATTSSRREIKMEYRKRGKQAPDVDMPTVEKHLKPVVQLSEVQRLAIREEITLRRKSKKPSDRAKFLWLWFERNFGMRPRDVENIKWSCISRKSNGSWWLDYIPTKTAKTGRHAGCRLSETLIEEIRPFIGESGEYVIPRHADRRPKSGCARISHGEYVGHHLTLRKYAIDFMRSIGVDDRKPQYALRKDCSQNAIRTKGIMHEAQMLGHTPKVAMTNYTDISKIEFREGL